MIDTTASQLICQTKPKPTKKAKPDIYMPDAVLFGICMSSYRGVFIPTLFICKNASRELTSGKTAKLYAGAGDGTDHSKFLPSHGSPVVSISFFFSMNRPPKIIQLFYRSIDFTQESIIVRNPFSWYKRYLFFKWKLKKKFKISFWEYFIGIYDAYVALLNSINPSFSCLCQSNMFKFDKLNRERERVFLNDF